MKVVYICSPYRGTDEERKKNIALAKRLCRKAALDGHVVICPHLYYPGFLDDRIEEERQTGLAAGLSLLELVDEVWVAEGRISSGMSVEIAKAGELGIPTISVCDPQAAEEHLLNALLSGKGKNE